MRKSTTTESSGAIHDDSGSQRVIKLDPPNVEIQPLLHYRRQLESLPHRHREDQDGWPSETRIQSSSVAVTLTRSYCTKSISLPMNPRMRITSSKSKRRASVWASRNCSTHWSSYPRSLPWNPLLTGISTFSSQSLKQVSQEIQGRI